jgi:GTP-binding protein
MSAFVDETRLEVRSGDGGAGSASFRREKYIPRGGPDGGDGGKGGDLVFVTRRNLSTLAHLKGKKLLKAKNGEPGRGRKMHGRDGEDMVISVPPGTRITDTETGEVLHDFSRITEGETWIFIRGGIGGLGNWHFRTSRNQRPTYFQDGRSGDTRFVSLELALIADIGLVGMPNSGKSSLINAVTTSRSRVGAYPFTTKIPNLGVMRRGDAEVVVADIPGLIEGAADGAGLGHKFLKHLGRAVSLAYLTDLGEEDPVRIIRLLEDELKHYDPEFLEKKRIIIGSKTDLDESGEKLADLRSAFPDDHVVGISVFTRQGLGEVTDLFYQWGTANR